MTELQNILIANIRKYRKRAKLTQAQLAETCQVSTNYIGEIESGRKYPSATVLQRIVTHLGIKPYMLLVEENDLEVFDRRELLERYSERIYRKIVDDLKEIKNDDAEDSE